MSSHTRALAVTILLAFLTVCLFCLYLVKTETRNVQIATSNSARSDSTKAVPSNRVDLPAPAGFLRVDSSMLPSTYQLISAGSNSHNSTFFQIFRRNDDGSVLEVHETTDIDYTAYVTAGAASVSNVFGQPSRQPLLSLECDGAPASIIGDIDSKGYIFGYELDYDHNGHVVILQVESSSANALIMLLQSMLLKEKPNLASPICVATK